MTPKAELIASLEALFGRGNVIELTEANLDEVAARLSGADPVAPDAECRCSRCAAGREFIGRVVRVVAPHTLGEMDRRDLRSPGDQLRIGIVATRNSSGGTDIGWTATATATATAVAETAPHILGEMDRRDLRSPGDQLRIGIIATRHSPSHIEFDVDVSDRT